MGYDGSVKIGTQLDKSGLQKGLSGLGTYAKKGFGVLGSTAKSAAKIATGAITGVGTAMVGLATMGVKYNASIESYETSFEVMTGSAEKAAEVIEELKKVGAQTPFELPDLADTTQLLMNYGFTADDAMDKMMMLGDISQGSADKMSRIAMAYGQMSSAGKVSLEDIKQMIEAGFNPLQEISESTGESMDSLYARISDGAVSVDEITASMQRATSEGGKYYQSMEKQSQTINGMISTLKDSAQQLIGGIVQPITESIASELLPAAIDAMDQLTTAFQTNGVEGLIQAGSQIMTNVIVGIGEALPGLIDTASQVVTTLANNLNENMPTIVNAGWDILTSLANGVIQMLPSLSLLALNVISELGGRIAENMPTIVKKGKELLPKFAEGVLNAAGVIATTAWKIITALVSALGDELEQVVEQGGETLANWLDGITSKISDVIDAGKEIVSSIVQGIKDKASDIINLGKTLVSDFIQKIKDKFSDLYNNGKEIIDEIKGGIKDRISNLISAIPEMAKNIGKKFLDKDWAQVGKDLINGIKNGIKNAAGGLVDAAVDAASNAIETVKGWLGIASPSKRAKKEIGIQIPAGAAAGVEEGTPEFVKASEESAKSAVEAMQGATAKGFVSRMQARTYAMAENNEISARNRYKNNGYEPDSPDEDETIIINNHFDVDGTPLVNKTVKRTKKEIVREQRSNMVAKGDVVLV